MNSKSAPYYMTYGFLFRAIPVPGKTATMAVLALSRHGWRVSCDPAEIWEHSSGHLGILLVEECPRTFNGG
mgnify:CR=1 FL=1